MQLQVLDFVNLLLNAAESKQQLIDEKVPYSGIVFNERLANNSRLFNYSLSEEDSGEVDTEEIVR